MTRKELQQLKDGTLLYNCRKEGEIRTIDGEKCIVIEIPIRYMSNDACDYNDRPEHWDIIEE